MKKILFLIIFLGLFWSCGNSGGISGTATDTGNTIAGVIEKKDGSFASGAVVRMLAKRAVLEEDDFNALELRSYLETVADSTGAFNFDSTLSDTFDLEVRLMRNEALDEVIYLKNLVIKDTIKTDLGSIRLQKAAYVEGLFVYDDVGSSLSLGAHFQIRVERSSYEASLLSGNDFSIGISAGKQVLFVSPADSFMIRKLLATGLTASDVFQRVEIDVLEGDTLNLGTIIWRFPVRDTVMTEPTLGRLKGRALNLNGEPLPGVEVRLIDDIYGFRFALGDLQANSLTTVTDNFGYWTLPFPIAVEDSFRVELNAYQNGVLIETGVSNYLTASALDAKNDTLIFDDVVLYKPASFMGVISLVANPSDPLPTSNCILNSIVVGFKGTSHFVRQITCYSINMDNLPVSSQELIFYTGDHNVLERLQADETPVSTYTQVLSVSLPEGATLYQQGITYTPPTKMK